MSSILDQVLEQSPAAQRERYGRRLRRSREGLGLSQQEVAARAGIDQARVSKAEKGYESSEGTLVVLERLYELPESYPSAPKDPVRRREFFDARQLPSRDAAVTKRGDR